LAASFEGKHLNFGLFRFLRF